MLSTHLVLLEGPPGSGKSTTAQKLADEIAGKGLPCQCFTEWSEDNPISVGRDLQLGEAVATALVREQEVLRQWRQLVRARQADRLVTVMESRFWQTSLMLMYAAGAPLESILQSNREVIEVIAPLQPALISLSIDDLQEAMAQTLQVKEAEWRQAGLPGSWAEHIFAAFDSAPWFRQRGLTGVPGMLAFLEAWKPVAERLFDQFPFPKVWVPNPYRDWPSAMQAMREFLGLSR